jgi:hypothetical protein
MPRIAIAVLLLANLSTFAFMRFYNNVAESSFPQRLKDNLSQHPIAEGFIDLTKPPYNAAGDGVSDDTRAIQDAVDDAYPSNLAVLFPEGTYLISKQIRCIQVQVGGPKSNRKFAHILIGSTKGGARPTIRVKDNVGTSADVMIYFQYYNSDNGEYEAMRHYCATFCGIDIDMGNNPTKNGLSMDGAQYCVIEDVTITGNFNAGIHRLPGSGGGTVNVKVVGGKIGILQTDYRPNPTVTGVVLEGQSEAGVKVTSSRGPVGITGFRIVSPDNPSPSYRAIHAYNESNWGADPSSGAVTLVDGSIEVKGDGTAGKPAPLSRAAFATSLPKRLPGMRPPGRRSRGTRSRREVRGVSFELTARRRQVPRATQCIPS